MSDHPHEPGFHLLPQGRSRFVVDDVETRLERHRPANFRARHDAVFLSPTTDFSSFGMVNPGFIHEVRVDAAPEWHDAWRVGQLQYARLRIKYPEYAHRWPDYTEAELDEHARLYWTTPAADAKALEGLVSAAVVVRLLSDQAIPPASSSGGFRTG